MTEPTKEFRPYFGSLARSNFFLALLWDSGPFQFFPAAARRPALFDRSTDHSDRRIGFAQVIAVRRPTERLKPGQQAFAEQRHPEREMLQHMQGFAFHTFAAVMTFTVLAFPTPSDLYNTVASRFSDTTLNEIRSFPTIEGYAPPVNNLVDSQEFIPVISACVVRARSTETFDPNECQAALSGLEAVTGTVPAVARITTDQEALKIATSFYCRAEWANQQRLGHTFDLNNCMGQYLAVAQALD